MNRTSPKQKVIVEIWSDIACPFCYIGMKRFEQAIEKFPIALDVVVTWKTFLLNPGLQTNENQSTLEYLAQSKGVTAEEAKSMMQGVIDAGKTVDIPFDFNTAKVANTLKAHALLKTAKDLDQANDIKKALFKAQFETGKFIDNDDFLLSLSAKFGLDAKAVKKAIANPQANPQIQQDLHEAQQIGISGVPFFVFNRSFALVGAQSTDVFMQALEKALQTEEV